MVVHLHDAIATEQLVVEEDAHFGDVQVAGNDQGADHIFQAIGTDFRGGNLSEGNF